MSKLKIGVILGGMSTEHDVSILSGTSVLKNLDKNQYEILPIYLDKLGKWYSFEYKDEELKIGVEIENKIKIENIEEYLKKTDVIFPVLHGLYGEDGTIQGMLELLKMPYVGSKVLGSALCMDKAYAKIIFEKAKIKQANWIYVKKIETEYIIIDENFDEYRNSLEKIAEKINEKIQFPMFVKPSNSGSSVGINKAKNIEQLKSAINYAGQYDNKILIEEAIVGKEVECSVLGNNEPKASCVGEILPADEFYSYDAKYNNVESKTVIPAILSENLSEGVRKVAIKAYKSLDCRGLARVDFFVNEKTNTIYINEINTIPGFTQISMYPKLWEKSGIKYSKLLDELINLALEK